MKPTDALIEASKRTGSDGIISKEKNILGDLKTQNALEKTFQQQQGSMKAEGIESDDVSNRLTFITEKRDIILENDITNQRYCMPSIEVKFLQGGDGSLFFSDLIDRLKDMKFPLQNCMLFCWDEKKGMHVFVVNDPITKPHFLPAHLCGVQNNIYIKFRSYEQKQPILQSTSYSQSCSNNHNNQQYQQINRNQSNSNPNIFNNNGMNNQNQQMIKEEDQMLSDDNNSTQGEGTQSKKKKKMMMLMGNNVNNMRGSVNDKRVKERYIEKVREKVSEWRSMHETGFRDKDGNLMKLNLDHAANYIGISRKTLDDYYLQLRRAEQLGFDFEKNKSEKMGALRKFVKEETKRQSKKGMSGAGSNNASFNLNYNNIPTLGNTYNNNSLGDSDEEDISSLSQVHSSSTNKQNINQSNNLNSQNQFNNNPNIFGATSINNSHQKTGISNNINSIGSNHSSNSNNNNSNNNNMVNILKSMHSSASNGMNSMGSNNSNNSVNIIGSNQFHSLMNQNNQNSLLQQQNQFYQLNHQNHNANTILTPYNYNQQQPYYSSGGYYNNSNNNNNNLSNISGINSNLSNNNNTSISPLSALNSNISNNNNPANNSMLLQYQSRGSFIVPENILSSGIENSINNIQGQNSNISNNRNSASIFNPGSSFLSNNNQHSGNFGPDFGQSQDIQNLLTSNNTNNNSNLTEQRFSNHFQLMQAGNTSQMLEERNSITFLNNNNIRNSNNQNENNNNNASNRHSNSSIFQLQDDNNVMPGISSILNS